MTETARVEDIQKSLFVQLVMMLATSASQQMGKLADPATGRTETNLEAAQMTIDLLDMLAAKTKGNLDRDEDSLLKNTIASLKLAYVEAREEQAAAPQESAPPPKEEPPRSGVRFQKKY